MQKREKYLMVGLVGAMIAWYGVPMIHSTFSGPLEEKEARRQTLAAKLKTKVDKKNAIIEASSELGRLKSASLPPNDLDAQRLYQRWLTELALGAGFGNLKIAPGRRTAIGQTAVAVQVGLDADATLEELTRFVNQFRRTDLLHRVVQVAVESPTNQGNPRFKVSMMAEGVALLDAPSREKLFPETELQKELTSLGKSITVDSVAGFPQKPGFRVRIGSEYALVTKMDGPSWTLTRGLEGTSAKTYPPKTLVELAPVRLGVPEMTVAEAQKWISRNPFALPAPPKSYQPKFSPIASQSVFRGSTWKSKLFITDLDPQGTKPTFALVEPTIEGLKLDSTTGEMSWTPASELDIKTYAVKVTASWSDVSREPLSQSFQISLKDPNRPPALASVPAQTVYFGRTLSFKIRGTDDGPASQLTYRLGDGAPAGATIDSKTGEVRWTPPETLDSTEVTIPVVVADGGSPALTATQSVRVSLQEDTAQFTYLVASIAQDGKTEAWLYDRATNQRRVLVKGSTFQIADISGRVKEIARDSVLIEIAGVTSKLPLGESLRTMKPLPTPDPLPPSSSASLSTEASTAPAEAEIPVREAAFEESAAMAEIPESNAQ